MIKARARLIGAARLAALTLATWLTAAGADHAFVGVNVVTMEDDQLLRNRTVLVLDGKIAALGPREAVDIPEGVAVIEGKGRYLVPGLAEMHAHVPGVIDRRFLEDVLFLYVAHGITTARGMLGQAPHLKLRQDIAEHRTLGPRLFTSGPSLNGNSVSGPDSAARMVREQAAAGYDFVKLHPGLTREEYDAAMAAGREAGIPLAGHVSQAVGIGHALESGQATVDHLDGYMEALVVDPGRAAGVAPGFFGANLTPFASADGVSALARRTAGAGVWIVPTQSLMEHVVLPTSAEQLAGRSENQYMPPRTVRRWANSKQQVLDAPSYSDRQAKRFIDIRRRLIKAMDDRDVLLLGSDAPQVFNVPGFSLHHELESLRASGLSPYRALRTGTVNVARFFGATDRFGRVAEGLDGDLILAAGNPLDDLAALRRPEGVMVRGRWLTRGDLDRGLAEIAARHR